LNVALPWIEIVECLDPDPQLVLWRYPDPDGRIKSGAKLIVRENQNALLLAKGQAAGVYLPGTYSLPTGNIPVLSNLAGWKYGFASPHIYDIFYIATRQFVDLKWGTPAPVMMADEKFGQVRVRAFGSYSARITDIPRFFREYAGAYPVLTIRDLEVQLRDYIAAKFGEVLATQQISVLDVAANLSAVNARLLPAIAPYFLDLGVTLTQFTVTSVTLPDEVNDYYDKVTSMNMIGDMSRFQAFNTAIATANPNTIRTPQLAPTFELLDEIMASSIYDADHIRGAAVINAAPALGKTTITTAYARRYHGRAIPRGTVQTPEDHRRLPMVYVPLSEGVPLKSLNQKLLRFYGHPTATHCTRAKLGSLVADFVHSCATGMMVMA